MKWWDVLLRRKPDDLEDHVRKERRLVAMETAVQAADAEAHRQLERHRTARLAQTMDDATRAMRRRE